MFFEAIQDNYIQGQIATILIFGFELIGIGLTVFFVGIPLFWNLRSQELVKQQKMINEYSKDIRDEDL